jgi:hypothetical protein
MLRVDTPFDPRLQTIIVAFRQHSNINSNGQTQDIESVKPKQTQDVESIEPEPTSGPESLGLPYPTLLSVLPYQSFLLLYRDFLSSASPSIDYDVTKAKPVPRYRWVKRVASLIGFKVPLNPSLYEIDRQRMLDIVFGNASYLHPKLFG